MIHKVVYDTNVIVSAALKENSTPRALLDLALEQQVHLFLSPIIWEEYQAVSVRPKFHHDPDNRFLECAHAAHADYLVAGNKKHFPFPEFAGTQIVSPKEFARVIALQLFPQTGKRSVR